MPGGRHSEAAEKSELRYLPLMNDASASWRGDNAQVRGYGDNARGASKEGSEDTANTIPRTVRESEWHPYDGAGLNIDALRDTVRVGGASRRGVDRHLNVRHQPLGARMLLAWFFGLVNRGNRSALFLEPRPSWRSVLSCSRASRVWPCPVG